MPRPLNLWLDLDVQALQLRFGLLAALSTAPVILLEPPNPCLGQLVVAVWFTQLTTGPMLRCLAA
eukprot:m.1550 g.1550  ORF g.1550 m.1550 type:complete len:65 (-) comp529_c1_seq1:255-449(-)